MEVDRKVVTQRPLGLKVGGERENEPCCLFSSWDQTSYDISPYLPHRNPTIFLPSVIIIPALLLGKLRLSV